MKTQNWPHCGNSSKDTRIKTHNIHRHDLSISIAWHKHVYKTGQPARCLFSCGHCVVCAWICGFWWTNWYNQAFLLLGWYHRSTTFSLQWVVSSFNFVFINIFYKYWSTELRVIFYTLCLCYYFFYIVLSLYLYCCYVVYPDHHFTVIYHQTCVLCVCLCITSTLCFLYVCTVAMLCI